MTTSLKPLPPSEWRIMYILWRNGPLTVLEVQKLSPDHNVNTIATFLRRLEGKGYVYSVPEASSPQGGRPPERFYPRVDYPTGLELAVQNFLLEYILGDPDGLAHLAHTVQDRLGRAKEMITPAPAKPGNGRRSQEKPS
jgi:hypothetical protein